MVQEHSTFIFQTNTKLTDRLPMENFRRGGSIMEIKYCPKCHKETYRLQKDGDNIKITQGKSTVLNLNKTSSVSMSLNCPSGHPVKINIEEGVA